MIDSILFCVQNKTKHDRFEFT